MSATTPRTSKRFQIEVIENRMLTETIMRVEPVLDADGEKTGRTQIVRDQRVRKVPESYMVYFPGGHSIWCETKADLARLKLTEDENFEVDLETGLPVEPPKHVDLKSRVERMTRSTRQ